MTALERRLREQAAIEEGNVAEAPCRRRALADGRVEGAEEQGQHDPLMEAAAARHALVEPIGEERAVVVEPSLGLEKGQEEESRRGDQRELRAGGIGHALQRPGEGAAPLLPGGTQALRQ